MARKTSKKRDEQLDRMHRAMSLRLQGLTQAEIGEELGITPQTVSRYLSALRDQWRREDLESVDRLRGDLLAMVTEIVGEAMRSHARSPSPGYLFAALAGLDRIAKWSGVDAVPPGSDGELPEIDRTAGVITIEQARAILPLGAAG